MFKKVAILLILVLVCNMTLWGEENIYESKDDNDIAGIVISVIAGIGILLFLIWVTDGRLVEADSPDDGIRMVSMESEESTNTPGNNLLNVLKHVEAGITQNNDVYLGLRFQY